MSGINQFIIENLSECTTIKSKLYISPEIPQNIIEKFVKAIEFDGDSNSILGVIDSSALGISKGTVLTGKRFIFKDALKSAYSVMYSDISGAEVEETVNEKGKVNKFLHINLKEDYRYTISDTSEIHYENIAGLLNKLVSDFDLYEEQGQLTPIDQLSDELKKAYVKIIINMTYSDDGEVDQKEFSEVMQLMTRIDLVSDSRVDVRNYLVSSEGLLTTEELIRTLDENTPDGMRKSIHLSLVKDLISIYASTKSEVKADFDFLKEAQVYLDITDDQVDLAVDAIKQDYKILNRSYTDDQITKSIKELSSKAAAVGIPLGAIYLSGSVIGMSAAGMTSGLATIGMGGVLGLSSMATGIGAAVILGVVAYKGVKYLTNSGTEEGDKRRELMLQNVIRLNQKTLNLIIQDINELVKRLNIALKDAAVTKEQVQMLGKKLAVFIGASEELSKKNQRDSASQARLSCPEFLDVERLKVISKEGIDKKPYNFVLSHYEENVVVEKDEQGGEVEKHVLRLRKDLSTEKLVSLGDVLTSLGYNETSSAVKSKAENLKKKALEEAKNRFGGFFSK
ncbi:MAG: hypothetical protein COW74_02185 [Piscirickettsiaceae bacterium CG18_big_fil_WC_8_21_14_2_50_44_103]|nr:MAG: hypothetical protein COW74_02185 [Piscirickettsiaceae bacterium CG18_big_fil_WC_8_21_14_2_50_44_103]